MAFPQLAEARDLSVERGETADVEWLPAQGPVVKAFQVVLEAGEPDEQRCAHLGLTSRLGVPELTGQSTESFQLVIAGEAL
jgi:hypothetical protein